MAPFPYLGPCPCPDLDRNPNHDCGRDHDHDHDHGRGHGHGTDRDRGPDPSRGPGYDIDPRIVCQTSGRCGRSDLSEGGALGRRRGFSGRSRRFAAGRDRCCLGLCFDLFPYPYPVLFLYPCLCPSGRCNDSVVANVVTDGVQRMEDMGDAAGWPLWKE